MQAARPRRRSSPRRRDRSDHAEPRSRRADVVQSRDRGNCERTSGREIDALGGIMGRVIDRTGIQFRLLNRSRGPAVQSPRAQADRMRYRAEMRRTLEATSNLHCDQGKVVDRDRSRTAGGRGFGRRTTFGADAVVVATGTFLNGLIHTGRRTYSGGRAGEPASIELSGLLKRLDFRSVG